MEGATGYVVFRIGSSISYKKMNVASHKEIMKKRSKKKSPSKPIISENLLNDESMIDDVQGGQEDNR